MSYNPIRAAGIVHPRREKKYPSPNAGVTHSQIMKRRGAQSASIDDIRNRQITPRGWKVVYFQGDAFEMVYEFINAKNSTGLIKNKDLDRSFRVLSGQLFITIDTDIFPVNAGQSFSLPKDLVYQLATFGTGDTEVIFCQGPKYEETLTRVSEKDLVQTPTNVFLQDERLSIKKAVKCKTAIIAQQQAEVLAQQRKARDQQRQKNLEADVTGVARVSTKRVPMVGQMVIGVNPKFELPSE